MPEERIAPARALVVRAQERMRLSRGYTVVALAGATGSGKSSLFNAVARIELSPVGLRRPTTGGTHACVWGPGDSAPLLDWLGVPAERRFERESALDAEDEAPLRGLVLLDLPDFDSVVAEHRAEVDRLLAQVDLVVWVTDPQKYADQVIHQNYLRSFQQHRDVMVVVLNQADRLSQADTVRCVGDLRRMLDADGLDGIPVFATSAVATPPGVRELRGVLEKAVHERQAALRRLDDDLTEVTSELTGLVGAEPAKTDERGAEATLANALARAAGVASVAESAARAYRRRAGWSLRWLPVRPPWRSPIAEPRPVPVQQAAAGLAVRRYGQLVSTGLPEPWPGTLDRAARSRLADLPAAWNAKYAETLGVTPTNDAEGCLQDIHWSAGLFGYFPTYTLGNLYAAQLFARANADLPGLDDAFGRGDFSELLAWLRDKIHRHGRRYAPTELIERAVDAPIDHRPLMASLRHKYGALYGV